MDLLSHMKQHEDIDHVPLGIHAVVHGDKPGVIFVLKNVNENVNVDRQNPHRLVFLLCYEQQRKLVIYHGKLYESEWMESEQVQLLARGYSMDEIWDHIIEQIALPSEEKENDLSIEERLKRKDEIEKLIKLIDRTEKTAWKEQQPKKRFELYSRVQEYRKKLKEMRNGEK